MRHVWGANRRPHRVLVGKESTWKTQVLIGRIILKWNLIRWEGVDLINRSQVELL
jgi:hypothetical protein